MLSILQWVLTIIYVSKNYKFLGREINHEKLNHYNDKVSFTHDYFYIYWNLYPIIFYLFFYYIETSWNNYLTQIVMIAGEPAQELYNSFFKELYIPFIDKTVNFIYIDLLAVIIMITFAYFATFRTQVTKQIQFIQKEDKVYWWDIRISPTIFWIRFIFLFFNMILVGFIAYLTTKVALFILMSLSLESLTVNPFHPDLFGGLKVLMEISSVILAIYLLRAVMGIVGFLDHKGVNDKFQFIGDLYHSIYFFLGIAYIITFIYQTNIILDKASEEIKKFLTHDIYIAFKNDINSSLQTDMNSTITSQVADKIANLSNYYETLLQFNKFPIDLSIFTSSIFTFILPLAIWFLVSFIDNRKQNLVSANKEKQ
jgi:hypothetical protein